jgi:iron complex transport system substrate-binding protein
MSRIRALTAAVAATFVLAACGGSSATETTVPEVSLRIVSLSPTATEMLYAIGAGDQVVAVDSLSTYPAEVADKVTKMSAYEPSVEAILGYKPDVVLISNDMNKITEQLESISSQKITVWTGAAATTLDDVYKQIGQLGTLTGHDKDASKLIESMKSRIAKATENVSAPMSPKSYFYELDNTPYSVTSNTFIGALLKPFGLTNIADGVEAGNDYPQLNAEAIVKANPSIIFLADTKCCATSAVEVAKRPGWSGIDAVKNNHVVELDDDVASRWGPRVVDLVEQFATAITALATASN